MPYSLRKHLSTAPLWIVLTVFTAVMSVGLGSGPTIAQTTATDQQETNLISETKLAAANLLFRQGLQQYQVSQFRDALQSWEQALELYRELGDRAREGSVLGNLGTVYRNLGQYQEALDLFEESLIIVRELGDRSGEGATLGNLGLTRDNLGEYQQALYLFERSLIISREVGDRSMEGNVLGNLGNTYNNLGRYEQAIQFYEQQLTIVREIADLTGEGIALNNLGEAYRNLGQYNQSISLYEEALMIFRNVGHRTGENASLGNLGVAYEGLGQYQKAIEFYKQAIAIAVEIEDRVGEGNTLNNLGSTHLSLGQYQQTIVFCELALAIAREINNRKGESTALGTLGTAYLQLGQYQQAINHFEQALAIDRELGDFAGEGDTLNGFGNVYAELGQYQQAINLFEQSLAVAREVGARTQEGNILNNLGNVYLKLGQYQQAIELYKQRIFITREISDRAGEGNSLGNLGLVYTNLGQYQQAITLFEQHLFIVREIDDRAGEGRALGNLGLVYTNLGQYEQSLEGYQQALAIAQEIGAKAGEGLWLSNIGKLLTLQDQPELAIVFYKQSVNVREEIRNSIKDLSREQQQSFTDTIADDYRELADLLLQQDRILEAQRILDLLKVQELDDYINGVERNSQTETGILLRPAEQALSHRAIDVGRERADIRAIPYEQRSPAQRQRLIEIEDEILPQLTDHFFEFIDSEEIQALVAQLSREAREQDIVAEMDEFIGIQDNLAALNQNAVLLYPLILEDRLELVLVTPDSLPTRYPIAVGKAELNKAITAFRQALGTPRSQPEALAQQLYQWLIEPLAADLEAIGAETILYAPDGPLRYIPLAALHDGEQWLTERFRVNHITAASLSNLNLEPAPDLQILAAAFSQGTYPVPVGERQISFSGLPYAGQEVDNLAAAFPGTTKLVNNAFAPDATVPIMDDHTIVHLATHATFVPGTPYDSFILFGNGDRITLAEIKRWRGRFQNVDLMVLSACETGVGDDLGNGEEILGFGYLMQEAGARAAIASLWQVSDGGTQTLMDAFYTALNNGHTKTEALRRAQLALIHNNTSVLEPSTDRGIGIEWTDSETPLAASHQNLQGNLNHPYYWAPFILIGNGL